MNAVLLQLIIVNILAIAKTVEEFYDRKSIKLSTMILTSSVMNLAVLMEKSVFWNIYSLLVNVVFLGLLFKYTTQAGE